MPRTKYTGGLPNPRAVSKLIMRYIKIERGLTVEEATGKAQVSRTLYYNRMKSPGDFTLTELRCFGKALNIPQEELSAALAEALKY